MQKIEPIHELEYESDNDMHDIIECFEGMDIEDGE